MNDTIQCSDCEIEFSPAEKHSRVKSNGIRGGKYTQCLDCASPDPVPVYTGVMMSGTKTAAAIQINKDPKLTEYMLKSSPSAGSRHAMVQTAPKQSNGQVAHYVNEIAKRRE